MYRIMMVDLTTGECRVTDGGWGRWNDLEYAIRVCGLGSGFDCDFGGGKASGNVRCFPVPEEEVELHTRGPWRDDDNDG